MENMILVKNDFPYYLEDNIEHWCLWKLGADVTQEDIDWALGELKGDEDALGIDADTNADADADTNADVDANADADTTGDTNANTSMFADVLYWINPVHLKSLPEIDHAHLVCLQK